ncbi:major facilitator superfamily domain-containing protein [Sparassis latifolia]|uniref:Aspyridones efflux protein n=1 Tax=Sparassis crispa TaxID=139825 RepID=A0A401GMX5_9APHY|nr:Aspyridones efflux protein [Sparassis crispa]GBE83587.1 Aspyridones efflux protein [Sparassis crispa]
MDSQTVAGPPSESEKKSDELSLRTVVVTPTNTELDFPEGGWEAWTVVFGGFMAFIASFGVMNTYGVFQDYYSSTLLTKSSSSTISLIGAIQIYLLYGAGPIVGRIYDAYGTSVIIPVGSFLTVFSLMMVSLAQENQPYQLFLSQGILFGIGIAAIFNPAMAVVGHWFRRRRAYAMGIVASGSSVGGVFFPIMLQRLIPTIGFPWAVRAMAFVCLFCLVVACFTIRTRLPGSRRITLRGLIDFDGFRDKKYVFAAAGAFLIFYALFIPYFYIEIYADMQGVPHNLAIYLLPIINATGIPSRIIPGILADRFGCLNVLVPSSIITSIFVLALWLPARNSGEIIAFAALYGLFTGGVVSLLPAYIYKISPLEKYGARLGSLYMVVGIATLVGTPTAGAFVHVVNNKHFNGLIIFCGVFIAVGGAILGLTGAFTKEERASAHVGEP